MILRCFLPKSFTSRTKAEIHTNLCTQFPEYSIYTFETTKEFIQELRYTLPSKYIDQILLLAPEDSDYGFECDLFDHNPPSKLFQLGELK